MEKLFATFSKNLLQKTLLLAKAKALEDDPGHQLLYASFSYILLAAGIFTASL